ncbi:MAG: FecR family protein, partial [Acidobacteriota bacterium]
MKNRGPINEELVERVAGEIREQRLDDDTVHQAVDRVWKRLENQEAGRRPLASCEDFQAAIPALVAGTLPEARALLVADHTRECVPCRRALIEARGQTSGTAGPARKNLGASRRRNRILLRVAAALLAITGGVIGVRVVGNLMANRELRASVQAVDGSLQFVAQNEVRELDTGSFVLAHQVVRTKKDSGAFLRLGDGSVIEMDERSELALKASQRGTTIDLRRGNIIVHAADQHGGRLFVGTNDCTVAVKGTIFAVDHGLKGSRVSVIEGEVEVVQGSRSSVLQPGDQLSTDARLRPVPLEDEFSWSRDAENHRELVRALRGLRRAVAGAIDTAPPRSSTRLLDMAPGDTLIYAAIPNLTADLDAARAALAEHLAASNALSEWWQA